MSRGFILFTFCLVLSLTVASASIRPPEKRLNFNFMRTWQPFNGAPIPPEDGFTERQIVQRAIDSPRRRIHNRLLCMAALANPIACSGV
ncbi:unnamed protein product [Bursaphelenchus xylophilus]|uniref:(pine wood nematode) hypothetical protein n=1 Tax=Bursaphelenchus xylophilus TaxID=6326 RepID=A0A1I7RH66_BURXY|nr:unnamed protein product [Bursaphelenchus xylophilus]CAG9115958.1 unnamed protein product [Bursaphelenchus xylophilus]